MPKFTRLDETELARRDNQEIVRMQGRQVLRRVLNEALHEQELAFQAGLKAGKVLQLDPDKGDLKALLYKVAVKELGPAPVEAEGEEVESAE